jgi:hypothetical protein
MLYLFSILIFAGISYLFGHYVIIPVAHLLGAVPAFRDVIAGAIILYFLIILVKNFMTMYYNVKAEEDVINYLPDTFREVSDLGVKTPLDYCVAMIGLFSYDYTPTWSIYGDEKRESTSDAAWSKAVSMFERYFGRKPNEYDTYGNVGWGVYVNTEAMLAFQKDDVQDLKLQDVYDVLSPKLKEHFQISISDNTLDLRYNGK